MSWITVDTKLGKHPKMAALPNDAARYGWLLTLCEAKEQSRAGTFATANHFAHVMGRHGRFLDAYIKAGLLDNGPDGTLLVHDWQRHQWAAAKEKQRGHSEDISRTLEGQEKDLARVYVSGASRPVPVPVYVSSSTEGVQGEPWPNLDPEAQTFLEGLTGRQIRQAGDKQLAEYDRQIADHGLVKVVSAYQRVARALGPTPTATQLVWSGRKVLEPFVDPRDVADAEKSTEPTHGDRIYGRMHARRLERYQQSGVWLPEWGEPPSAQGERVEIA